MSMVSANDRRIVPRLYPDEQKAVSGLKQQRSLFLVLFAIAIGAALAAGAFAAWQYKQGQATQSALTDTRERLTQSEALNTQFGTVTSLRDRIVQRRHEIIAAITSPQLTDRQRRAAELRAQQLGFEWRGATPDTTPAELERSRTLGDALQTAGRTMSGELTQLDDVKSKIDRAINDALVVSPRPCRDTRTC